MKFLASTIYSGQSKFYEYEIVKKYTMIYFKEIFNSRLLIGTLFFDLIVIVLNLVATENALSDLKIFLGTNTFNIVVTNINLGVIAVVVFRLFKLEKQLNLSSLYKVLLINPRVFVLSKSLSVFLFIVLPYMVLGMLYFYSRP